MSRSILTVLVLASVVAAGDPPLFQGLSADEWAARLGNQSTRDAAGTALAGGGPDAVAVLAALLRSRGHPDYVIWVLEVVPDSRAMVQALVVLLADDDAGVRRQAAASLWRLAPADTAAAQALVRALSDPEEDVAGCATGALGSIGAAAVPALTEALSDPRVRCRAADALARIGPAAAPATEPLRALLNDATARWDERGKAADALGTIGARAAVPDLARGLADPEESVRRNCAEALGKIGEAAAPAVPALLGAIADPYEPAREQARGALWLIGEPAIRALVEKFREGQDRTILGAALAAGKRSALPYLVPLLSDPKAPWLEDAEAALVLVGWEALYALPADHPSAPRVTHLVLTEGVLRHARPPERYRAVAGAPSKVDPLAINAAWETGSGHGFTLALHRGRWTPEGFSVRAISYVWKRPRRTGEREVETVAVRTTTIPRARAEAMWRMTVAATGITFEEERPSDGTGWFSSSDFHVAVSVREGDAAVYEDRYTGYASSGDDLIYGRIVACTDILGEGTETCGWAEVAPNDEDRAILAARLVSIAKDSWWVRERLLLIAKAIGDARCLPPIEAFLATEPDETPRDHGYAIDAYARISGIDLRPAPFRDEDVAATRLRYLARFAKRDG